MIDIQLNILYSAETKHWRVSDAAGIYWEVGSIDELPEAVRRMLRGIGSTLKEWGKEITDENAARSD